MMLKLLLMYILLLLLLLIKCSVVVFGENILIERNRIEDLFTISIIHMNDFHANFEATSVNKSICNPDTEQCVGGYARVTHIVKELKAIRPNPIYLNAGDNFQGTIWYTIGRWNVTSYFLNLLPADVMTLGNHEFDDGIEGIVPFLETIKSPIVVCNIDDSEEPTFQGKYQKSIVIERDGRQIGVIGVISSITNTLSNTGNLKFIDECEAILTEIDVLKKQHINIIIILSHCGLEMDRIIAQKCGNDIDIIVGGHSHTIMYNNNNSNSTSIPPDLLHLNITVNYPDIVNNVLIVQAYEYTKLIGDIQLHFDELGKIVNYEGAPHFLDTNVSEDKEMLLELAPWKTQIDLIALRKIGESKVNLETCGSGGGDNNNYGECNLGNLITDSFVNYYNDLADLDEWTNASIAIINNGGIRAKLDAGIITYSGLITILPYENTVDTFELRGDYLWQVIEFNLDTLQVSGLKIAYNISKSIGNRLMSIDVLCKKCDIPEYRPIDMKEMYKIIMPSYLINAGGDEFIIVKNNLQNYKIGPVDVFVLENYINKISPIISEINGRIKMYV